MTDRAARAARFEEFRRREFGRLEAAGITYVDYTGSGLYAASHVRAHAERLCGSVLGNPHSESGPSSEATRIIEATRADVLDFFDADPDEWTVVFAANASAAAKLVGEAFPFGEGSRLVLLQDNHNSMNGLREYARAAGAAVEYLKLDDELRLAGGGFPTARLEGPAGPSLFAFPAQSNFSGVRHPLTLATDARRAGYSVMLDAAAYVPTSPLPLRSTDADFVCISFYKMFGFPTGVGALLARRESLAGLRRPWFSGGTVEWVTVETGRRSLLPSAEAFEDGTPNFLDIAAVSGGLELLREIGMEAIRAHVADLTVRLLESFASAETALGRPLVDLYGPRTIEGRGATVSFNLLDEAGGTIPYEEVERAARDAGIAVRGGCFCNPGASERAFGVDPARTLACLEGVPRGEFHPRRLGDCLDGAPVGAVRASFGIASTAADVDRLVDFLVELAAVAAGTPGSVRARQATAP